MNYGKKKELLQLIRQYRRGRLLQKDGYTIFIILYCDVQQKLNVKKIMNNIEKDLVRKFPTSGVNVKIYKKQHMGAMLQLQVDVEEVKDKGKISRYLDKNIYRIVGKQADNITTFMGDRSRTLRGGF